MTDSTDNARGPERIWHAIDRRGKIEACPDAHVQPCDDVASAYVEYCRADLPPTDAEVMAHPKVKALVDAAEEQLDYLEMCGEDDDLVRNLRAALAGLTEGQKDGVEA